MFPGIIKHCCDVYFYDSNCAFVGYNKNNKRCMHNDNDDDGGGGSNNNNNNLK